jgi:AraC family transcriptional regulator of arabinose operon
MVDLAATTGATDAKADRLIHRLAFMKNLADGRNDPEVAPLLPGYTFGQRLMSGLTPVERDGLLDFAIERPDGLDGWSLLLTVRGCGVLLDRPGEVMLRDGDMLLLPPRVEHRYRRHAASPSWWHRWVYFQPRQTWLPWLSWRGSGARATLLRGQDDDFRQELERIFAEIDAWSINADAFATEMSFNLLERAILICSRYDDKPVADYDPRMAGVCAYIAEHIDRPLSLEAVAGHAHLSVSRLSHLFRARYGCSVMAWRDDLRLQLACRILKMTNAPIKQVAIKVGYGNPLHFTRMFSKRYGLSPSAYRLDEARTGAVAAGEATD